jgi:hypothetical protein
MKWRLALGLISAIVPIHHALGQDFPSHKEICIGGIVSKEKLAKAFVKLQESWLNLYIDAAALASEPQYRPQWRRIFTDPQFCKDNPGCTKLNPTTNKPDDTEAIKTVNDLRQMFRNSLLTQTRPGRPYSVADPNLTAEQYFLGPIPQMQLSACLALMFPLPLSPRRQSACQFASVPILMTLISIPRRRRRLGVSSRPQLVLVATVIHRSLAR